MAICREAIYHQNFFEYRHARSDGAIVIRLRCKRGDPVQAVLMAGEKYGGGLSEGLLSPEPMQKMWSDELFDYYEAVLHRADPRFIYAFSLTDLDSGARLWLDQNGLRDGDAPDGHGTPFPYAHAYPAQPMPDWARGCVGYQIFPDRFRRAGRWHLPLEKWGSERVENARIFGGNLRGIIEAVPYLHDLGVGVVYMTPVFLSDTSHRYNTFDYYQIDPRLGSKQDLRELTDALHRVGIRLMLDGVFNHAGLGFRPFVDAMERGAESRYRDWFFFGDTYDCGYMTFAHVREMPKLNLQNPEAAAYFLDVGRYWMREAGVDGWRLDVSPEVYPDFWRQFRKAVKQENPDALLVAECWDDSREWLLGGDMFDATMHYVLSKAIWAFFGTRELDLAAFDCRVNHALALYPEETQQVLWNFLGSHDTMRILTRLGGDMACLRAAVFFQMTHPGVPIVYYGDELPMAGGDDPDCRRCFDWTAHPEASVHRQYVRTLTHLRAENPALRLGVYRTVATRDDGLYLYRRDAEGQRALMVLATGREPVRAVLALPEPFMTQAALVDAMTGVTYPVIDGAIDIALESGQGAILLLS